MALTGFCNRAQTTCNMGLDMEKGVLKKKKNVVISIAKDPPLWSRKNRRKRRGQKKNNNNLRMELNFFFYSGDKRLHN